MCSSSSRVAASPVVPATTMSVRAVLDEASREVPRGGLVTAPSSSNGVAIAVSIPRSSVIGISVLVDGSRAGSRDRP